MLVRAKKIVALGVMTLVAAAISLPAVSFAATSPTSSVLSPMTQGLRVPVKMVLDSEGNVYVADQRAGGIVKLNVYGVPQLTIRTAVAPAGLAFAQDGTLLASQPTFVARYNVTTGQEVGRLAGGQLLSPAGIAVDDVTGFVYVADSKANQVEVYTASGAYVKAFGKGVTADSNGVTVSNPLGKLSLPTGITFEKASRLFAVADTLGNRVQFFDADGNYVKSIGNVIVKSTTGSSTAIGPLQFDFPVAVAFEYSKDQILSRMYVVDSFQGNVQVIDPVTGAALTVAGTAKNYIGSIGALNGQLMVPSDVVFDSVNNRLMVVNGYGNITIYGIDGGKNPVYVAPVTPVDPPPVVVVTPAPALVVAAVSAITKSASITISGTVDAGSTVAIVNQATSGSGNAQVVGSTWSYEVALVEGPNTLVVSAQRADSEKAVATAAVTLDTTPPSLVVSALANDSNASDPVQNISGTVTDLNGAPITITVNGAATVLTGNAFSAPVTLKNGSNDILVKAVDAVGNTTVNNRTLNYNAGSGLSVINPVDNSVTANSTLNINGTAVGALTVKVAGTQVAVVDGSWNAVVELTADLNTISIVATDVVGNSSSVKRTITLDSAKPALAIVTPAQDAAVNVPNVLIAGTVSDSSTLALEYSVNGTNVSVPVNAGAYSFNVDFASEGNYSVALTAKDAAGNTSTVVRNVIYDVTPPAFSLNQVNGVMPEKLSGTVEPGSSIVVKDGTSQVGSVVIADGSWSADLAGVNYNPENLLAVATDAAGNSTSKTLVYNFPDGTLNGTGKPTVQDALRSIRLVVNQTLPSALELAHYDIGPLVNGKPNPNGKIEIVDAILILRKALGLKSW